MVIKDVTKFGTRSIFKGEKFEFGTRLIPKEKGDERFNDDNDSDNNNSNNSK